MNKLAKFFRIAVVFLLLADIGFLFMPVIKTVQENYPTDIYSQADFIKDTFSKFIMGKSGLKISGSQVLEIMVFVVLPALLSVIFMIVSIVAGSRQIISGFAAIVTAVLNIVFTTKATGIGQIYKKQYQDIVRLRGLNMIMVLAVILIICGILIIITKPAKAKKNKDKDNMIPDVEQIHQEQIKPKYEFIDEARPEQAGTSAAEQVQNAQQVQSGEVTHDAGTAQNIENLQKAQPDDSGQGRPRGVMVGITGMYAGAEIPFKPGEELKFGRDNVNDVVFPEARKISRTHCTITWDAQKEEFYIVDNSSNGCFINEMDECIPQNLPIRLEVGTILDIGDDTNRFRLE